MCVSMHTYVSDEGSDEVTFLNITRFTRGEKNNCVCIICTYVCM